MRSDSIGQHSEARHEAPERHGAFNKALLFIVLEALMSISAAMAQEVRPATETIQPKLFTFRDKDIHEGIRELMLTQEERERAERIVESLKRLIEEINRPGLNTSLEKLVKEFFPDMLGTLGNADALPPRDVHMEADGDAASWIKLNAHTPIAFGIRKFFENEDRHRDIFKIMENEGEVRNFFVHEYFHFSGVLMYGGDEYSERVQDYGLLEEGMADYFAMLAAHEEGRTAPRFLPATAVVIMHRTGKACFIQFSNSRAIRRPRTIRRRTTRRNITVRAAFGAFWSWHEKKTLRSPMHWQRNIMI